MSYSYQNVLQWIGVGLGGVDNHALLREFEECDGMGIVEVSFDLDLGRLKGAMRAIELGSNEPNGIPDEYDTWLKVMFALKDGVEKKEIEESVAFDYWITWSNIEGGLDTTVAEQKWERSNPRGEITMGTIFFLAKEAGWHGERSNFWTAEEIREHLKHMDLASA